MPQIAMLSKHVVFLLAAAMNAEDELEDLQRKYELMEGERKATFESAQSSIRQNKDIIHNLREENKSLRSQLGVLKEEEPATLEKQVDDKVTELTKLKARADTIAAENDRKSRQIADMTHKLNQLSALIVTPAPDSSAEAREIRVLENRLDKAMIKLNEAQSIQRTYEKILRRLQEERLGFDSQLASMEKTLKSKEKDYQELLLLSHDAHHAKEMALAELHRFEQGVIEERNQRDKDVQDKKMLVQLRVEMNQRLEQRQKMLRQQQELEKAGELAMSATAALGELAAGMTFTEAEAEKQKLYDFEDAFKRLKEATGVADVNEVIQKFFNQSETHANLTKLNEDCQAKIEAEKARVNKLRSELNELLLSSSGNVSRRQVIEDYERQVAEANGKFERNKLKYEKLVKVLVDVNAGVAHLTHKLNQVRFDGEGSTVESSGVQAPTAEQLLVRCEAKISKLLTVAAPDPDRKLDGSVYEAKLVQRALNDIRVKMDKQNRDEPDDNDDAVDEDVWNRKHIKAHSAMVVEKQLRKQRAALKKVVTK